ncbi:hypothetical protein [Silvimonas amylolytica]|uniref:EF-hand domain-containing protein n=1 Tax=Silvimonas amylolytica TaxID=449663 RepID=A0ABQ2PSZ4_9NEIS|nr:hypothetical protein [Silvimonas amylolytica]GGP28064.1 hypothetical protein GCM10010971_38830 [Silvimonas amylolytica]
MLQLPFDNLWLDRLRRWPLGGCMLAAQAVVLTTGASHVHRPRDFLLLLCLIAVMSGFAWVHHRRRYMLMGGTPLTRIGSAPQGYVQVAGFAQALDDGPLVCPGIDMRCVWYQVVVEQRMSGMQNSGEYRYVDTLQSAHGFLLADDTGRCLIDPDSAEIRSTDTMVEHKDNWRYTARMICEGEPIYAIGEFVSVREQPVDMKLAVSQKLAEWKRDRADLLRRFDTDRNGQIDENEWTAARHAAEREVSDETAEVNMQAPAHVMRASRDGRPFLVATEDPSEGVSRNRRWAWLHLVLLIAILFGTLYLAHHPDRIPGHRAAPVDTLTGASNTGTP